MILGIDGPSGTGKTAIAKEISNILNKWNHLNTGVFFRIIALESLNFKYKKNYYDKIIEIIKTIKFDIDDECNILANNKHFDNKKLHLPIVSNIASNIIAKDLLIRSNIISHIKKIVLNKKNKNFIVEGRDINTNIFPNANYKIFLSASCKCRALRRFKQYKNNNIRIQQYDKVIEEICIRDYNDISRKHSPLLSNSSCIVIDSTNLTFKEICDKIIKIIN